MIKLLAFDLDNTLLERNNEIPEDVCELLEKCTNAGIDVAIATGRMYNSARFYSERLGGGSTIVCYNGSRIYENDGSIILEKTLSVETMRELIAFGRREGLYLQFYEDDRILVEQFAYGTSIDPDVQFAEVIEAGDFEKYNLKPSPKAMFVVEPEKLIEYQDRLKERMGNRVHIAQSQAFLIEIMPPNVNKAKSLNLLCKERGIKKEETMAFGDSSNDIEMIEWSGIGVAVGNAKESVKAAADYVCIGERSAGVAEAIRKFIPEVGNE